MVTPMIEVHISRYFTPGLIDDIEAEIVARLGKEDGGDEETIYEDAILKLHQHSGLPYLICREVVKIIIVKIWGVQPDHPEYNADVDWARREWFKHRMSEFNEKRKAAQ